MTGNGKSIRLLFLNQHYWPDVASTGQHLTDLAEHLASAGFAVEVLTSRAQYEGGKVEADHEETRRGVHIHRVRNTGFGRESHLGRVVDYLTFVVPAFLRVLFGRRRDAVICLTTPPLLPVLGALIKTVRGQTFGIWSMDLHPAAEKALGVFPPDAWWVRWLDRLNSWAHRKADFVVDLGPYMKQRLQAIGVPEGRLETVPVWSDPEEVRPVPDDENPLLEEMGLGDRFVVMYSGNAGLGHRFREVLEAMDRLKGHDEIFFLFVGGGPRRPEIEHFATKRSIPNFRYRDYFPRNRIKYSLSLADLHLVTLKSSMAGIAAPGKLYGIMASGTPALLVGPRESEPGHAIETNGVGTVVDPADSEDGAGEVTEAILQAYRSPASRSRIGRRAREVFQKQFSAPVALEQWESLLRGKVAGGSG